MKILLACSAGMSASLLEKSINKYMRINRLEGSCMTANSVAAKKHIKEYDVILLGPQVRFMLKSFRDLADDIPVDVISPADYAMANGENIYKIAKKLMGK